MRSTIFSYTTHWVILGCPTMNETGLIQGRQLFKDQIQQLNLVVRRNSKRQTGLLFALTLPDTKIWRISGFQSNPPLKIPIKANQGIQLKSDFVLVHVISLPQTYSGKVTRFFVLDLLNLALGSLSSSKIGILWSQNWLFFDIAHGNGC